jgi:hypothetical protein
MSYLEMTNAPLPDMSSGIISIWFRDATKGTAPPADQWPTEMIPPNTAEMVKTMSPSAIFYWNAYGMPIPSFPVFGPAAVYLPTPPPFPTDAVHMLLTFGDPNQSYDYCPWHLDFPDVIAAVRYTGSAAPGIGFQPDVWPPPYAAYFVNLGDSKGKFKVASMRLDAPTPKPNMVPQSFIGVDDGGYLIICLQTKTKAKYKGCAFALDKVTEMWTAPTTLVINEPHTYTQIGFPFPDGHWVKHPGYWNGYQFEYKDVSDEIMGVQPETFIIGGPFGVIPDIVSGPRVAGSTWRHLLFSFDISGSVTVEQPADPQNGRPIATTNCKAWLAVDDYNYTGLQLQRRFKVPDGFTMPLLPGMGTDATGFGPVSTYSRTVFSIGPNDILPQNAWIHGFKGNPRDGLPRMVANAHVLDKADGYGSEAGDFAPLDWAGSEWTLYGHGVAPGPWYPELDPKRPTVPDPKTFDLPQYDCPTFSIPTNGYPIGVPVSARHLAHNTGIEMGELQIWANKTLDTGDVKMRRLFIDEKGKPVPPKKAAEVLGKPDVMLHGAGNWKSGRNTGSTGIDFDGKTIPAGQFSRVAKIEKFLPDPQLNK